MEPYSFQKKKILLTGASGGLGSALAMLLAENQAELAISSRSTDSLNDLIAQLPADARVIPISADLSIPGQARTLAREALEALGEIDVLFNVAGVGYFTNLDTAVEKSIRHLFEVNTFSPLMLIKALLPPMKARGSGRIINICSTAGKIPIPTIGAYGGSKSSLAAMANIMRLELRPDGIDVLNIYPGSIDTAFEENALREEEHPGLCPRDRCGRPRLALARQVLTAASGQAGEIYLERQGKWLATAALVWPGHVDRKVSRALDWVAEAKCRQRLWKLLQVESALACNLKCIMCPWREISKRAADKGIMAPAVWEALKPHLKQVVSVDFTGGGEPLTQPNLVQWIGDTKQAGCEAGFLTNATLLTPAKTKQLLEAGIDWLCVSIDGADAAIYNRIRIGSDFERVCGNLAHFASTRPKHRVKVMVNFVLMPLNFHQVEDMVRLAHNLGVDQINFKQCDVIRGQAGKGLGLFAPKETTATRKYKKALARARKLARRLNIKTTNFAFTPEELPVCSQDPTQSLFVRHDGAVAPCINLAIGGPTTFLGREVTMPSVHYGHLPQEPLADLWESKSCRFYRTRFEERVRQYDRKFTEGFVRAASNREKLQQEAQAAMPEAPEGCLVCHYLYDV